MSRWSNLFRKNIQTLTDTDTLKSTVVAILLVLDYRIPKKQTRRWDFSISRCEILGDG